MEMHDCWKLWTIEQKLNVSLLLIWNKWWLDVNIESFFISIIHPWSAEEQIRLQTKASDATRNPQQTLVLPFKANPLMNSDDKNTENVCQTVAGGGKTLNEARKAHSWLKPFILTRAPTLFIVWLIKIFNWKRAYWSRTERSERSQPIKVWKVFLFLRKVLQFGCF